MIDDGRITDNFTNVYMSLCCKTAMLPKTYHVLNNILESREDAR